MSHIDSAACSCSGYASAGPIDTTYRVHACLGDEFDVDGAPDAKKWTYEHGFVRNEELQWYQPQNARIEKGLLVIEGRRERKPNPVYKPRATDWRGSREFAEYTSASLMTRGRHTWQYGY